jgi:hypothetical protein
MNNVTMTIFLSLGGNSTGDGFLIAPRGTTYDSEIALWTDAGTASVTLQSSPNNAGLVFSQTIVNVSTTPTIVTVHSTLQSTSRGDTTIQVLDGTVVAASFTITSVKRPIIHFKGRFEARFGTDGGFYNRNPIYSATLDSVVPPGWTWGLEGEPDFVPSIGNIPENLEMPVGRVVRYNNPVALRSHAPPVASTITSISGETSSGIEIFTTGDPLIGQVVNLGSNTYLAGNNPIPPISPTSPSPEEFWDAALEPMGLFELSFGTFFSGASKIGPFTHKATTTNEQTRSPDSRPRANGLLGATVELAEFGLPNLVTFSETRIDQLVADYNSLPAGDSIIRRNLVRRIGHLLSSVSSAKRTAVQSANPGAFTLRQGTLTQGWSSKEIYRGLVDANLVFSPNGSSIISYMSEFNGFQFESHMFAFHSDELCGYHKGTLTPHQLLGGTYVGDPHTLTVNGTRYDFQSVGEFTLLRNGNRMEIQVRQTPVAAANPLTDSYTGLTSCVSVITAVAVQIGQNFISLQPEREGRWLQFLLNGKSVDFPPQGMNLGSDRITTFDANGETGLRIDFSDGTVFVATPLFWSSYNIWYINVDVSHTQADEGIMGIIPKGSWLPRLRNGTDVGPMPPNLHDRYVTLYKTFADSWRVTDNTSMFVYESGTSTKTFTDLDWPAEKSPCKLKPEFQVSGAQSLMSIPIEKAEMICSGITIKDLHDDCVFDVATTGDKAFARGYHLAQDLKLYGTSIQILTNKSNIQLGEQLVITATVIPLRLCSSGISGTVTFLLDNMSVDVPVELDKKGRATLIIDQIELGYHKIYATFDGGRGNKYLPCSSPNILFTVKENDKVKINLEG